MNFINKIFGSKSQKKLKKITPLVSSINNLEDGYSLLSDEELKKYRGKFISRHERGESLDDLLPEAFATVREVAK